MKRTFMLAALAALLAVSAQAIGDSAAKPATAGTAVSCPDEGCTPCPIPCDEPCDLPCETACPVADGGAS
jgi:hypothetical protein